MLKIFQQIEERPLATTYSLHFPLATLLLLGSFATLTVLFIGIFFVQSGFNFK
jgi:hypothetical protein